MKNTISKILIIAFSISMINIGCKKDYLDTKPSNAITPDQAYNSLIAVNSSQTSTYYSLFAFAGGNGNTGHDNFGQKAIDIANDLMGTDMVVYSAGYGWFNADYQYTEWQQATATRRSDKAWSFYYDVIKQANLLLDNIANPANVAGATTADIERVKGEALGLRAWCYFNLINNFQQTYKGNESKPGVPIYITITTELSG
ncbi:hypothetical protein E3E36_11035, partial [Thermococcus sp. M36]|uniref:RagB/SusD family nutrient uptake outer membrane protein n=1 Tax=Thermococcus sp. M36 TaxID=1638261 RepID=UPI00143A163D